MLTATSLAWKYALAPLAIGEYEIHNMPLPMLPRQNTNINLVCPAVAKHVDSPPLQLGTPTGGAPSVRCRIHPCQRPGRLSSPHSTPTEWPQGESGEGEAARSPLMAPRWASTASSAPPCSGCRSHCRTRNAKASQDGTDLPPETQRGPVNKPPSPGIQKEACNLQAVSREAPSGNASSPKVSLSVLHCLNLSVLPRPPIKAVTHTVYQTSASALGPHRSQTWAPRTSPAFQEWISDYAPSKIVTMHEVRRKVWRSRSGPVLEESDLYGVTGARAQSLRLGSAHNSYTQCTSTVQDYRVPNIAQACSLRARAGF
eukprot:scaffold1315_cov405-Prasinococcus_capsulatus_cf.AAC.16